MKSIWFRVPARYERLAVKRTRARRHQYGWNAKKFSDLLGPLRASVGASGRWLVNSHRPLRNTALDRRSRGHRLRAASGVGLAMRPRGRIAPNRVRAFG